MPLPVFKTGVARDPGQAGSIPVRLRHTAIEAGGGASGGSAATASRARTPCWPTPGWPAASATLGRAVVKDRVAAAQERARRGEIQPEEVADVAVASLPSSAGSPATGDQRDRRRPAHQPRTGGAVGGGGRRAVRRAAGHTDVEFDLDTGRRARRGRGALDALAAGGPGRRGGARGEQRCRRPRARRYGVGRRAGDRGQPGRAGRDR